MSKVMSKTHKTVPKTSKVSHVKVPPITSLVIGDPHFTGKSDDPGIEFIEKAIAVAQKKKPTFIVILGDVLDTHDEAKQQAYKLAEKLIDGLSAVATTYVLMGNHDLINHHQFLTDNHFFGPFKKWPNVEIIDTPQFLKIEDASDGIKTFIFCPYVPPGRFEEALNTLLDECDWIFADCIFAHQSFEGCKTGGLPPEGEDQWNEDYPTVISGHIHEAQSVGCNIFYPGSSTQRTYAESANKRLWFVHWEPEDGEDGRDKKYRERGFSVEKVNLHMKLKKTIRMTVKELLDSETPHALMDAIKKCHVKLSVTGTSEELQSFRKSRLYSTLVTKNVIFDYDLDEPDVESAFAKELGNDTSCASSSNGIQDRVDTYSNIFRKLVAKKDEPVREEYKRLFGDTSFEEDGDEDETEEELYELIFVDTEEEESG